jgi:hypothetical protein
MVANAFPGSDVPLLQAIGGPTAPFHMRVLCKVGYASCSGRALARGCGMSLRRHSDDFRGRRVDLGIGTREMAAVVGVGLGRLLTIEDGKATDEDRAFYRAWLSRIEGWSTAERYRQIRGLNQDIRPALGAD